MYFLNTTDFFYIIIHKVIISADIPNCNVSIKILTIIITQDMILIN